MVKISVIVPIYNVSKYLRRCLDSLINQTFDDYEILCINDGSKDDSLDILNEYRSNEKIKIYSHENKGYGYTINKGIYLSSGKYFVICEPDDYCENIMLQELFDISEKHELDILRTNHFSSDENKGVTYCNALDDVGYNKVFYPLDNLNIFCVIPYIWSCLYKKDLIVLNNIKLLETKGASYQDSSFYFETMALADRVMCIDDAYVFYTVDNPNSSMHDKSKIFCICDQYAEIESFLHKNSDLRDILWEIKNINKYTSYRWNYSRLKEEDKQKFLNVFLSEFTKEINNKTFTSNYVDPSFWDGLIKAISTGNGSNIINHMKL